MLVLITFFCYLPGVTGTFYYDDIKPLSKLADVDNLQTAIHYVLTEASGPLGRPISMISFLFNANDWPENGVNFFYFNVVLHCLNGLCVFLLAYFIIKIKKHNNAFSVAFACCAFWLIFTHSH